MRFAGDARAAVPGGLLKSAEFGISGRYTDAPCIIAVWGRTASISGMCQSKGGDWRRMRRMSAPILLFCSALAALSLAGCAGSPFNLDPLSVNGRDGGGPTPTYPMLMRIGAAARSGGDLPNAVGVYRRAAEMAPQDP